MSSSVMATAEWEVGISGDDRDLDHLVRNFTSGPLGVYRDPTRSVAFLAHLCSQKPRPTV
jgi:hypothetical protein